MGCKTNEKQKKRNAKDHLECGSIVTEILRRKGKTWTENKTMRRNINEWNCTIVMVEHTQQELQL